MGPAADNRQSIGKGPVGTGSQDVKHDSWTIRFFPDPECGMKANLTL